MSLSVLYSCALSGMQAPTVCVEVHLSSGLPAFTIVGLPDTGVRESKERVRAAIDSSGWEFPLGRFTVNLAPTSLPKESGRFDLAIALGVLMSSGQVRLSEAMQSTIPNMYFLGELSLTGALLPIQAPLIIALSVYQQNPEAILVLPRENAAIAAKIPGLKVIGLQTLTEVAEFLAGNYQAEPILPLDEQVVNTLPANLCLSDIRGQEQACRVLEIAASGGHGVLLAGSPGVGKSMIAQRLPTLLPPLNSTQQLEVMAIYSLMRTAELPPVGMIPFRAPHHSASRVSLVGGGANANPGEISLAHHGVLFLDEFPEFDRGALEALREPLETGEIHIARARRTQTYPARFQLIAAYNPCPCGYFGHQTKLCKCTPDKIARYQSKLSGPLLDRIDIHLHVQALGKDWIEAPRAETSAVVRERVSQCRYRQLQRQGVLNAYLNDAQIGQLCELDQGGKNLLSQAMSRFSWSARVANRVLKVARTIADMRGEENVSSDTLSQAMMCRSER